MQPIYIDRTSPLHALHPLTKIVGAGLLLVATYTLPWQLAPLVIFGLVLAMAIVAGVARSLLRSLVIILLPIVFSLFLLASIVLIVIQTTHPADLVFALTERGLPNSIGYILLVSLQLVPDMSARASAILEAQRSRGLETRGLLRRARALPALVGPLVVGALADVEERAMALESRAYNRIGPKTSLRQLIDTRRQRVARWVMLLLIIALIAWRIARAFQF